MWLMTNFGYFSIVEKPDDHAGRSVTIRARVKGDLEALRQKYLPHLGAILQDAGTDYKYRAKATRSDFAIALLQIALDIDYGNFKNSVAKQQGAARSNLYHKVWDVLSHLEDQYPAPSAAPMANSTSTTSFGGVLFDGNGRVLLRKPKGEFDNYVWTFAKGRQQAGETEEEAALREVREETGYRAEIVSKLQGSFVGGTGTNEYFLMRPVGEPEPFDSAETEAVEWVTTKQAAAYIKQTRNRIGQQRDLAVLRAAIAAYQQGK